MFMNIKKRLSRVVRLNKRHIAVLSTVLAAALIFGIIDSPAIIGASATTRKLPIYSVGRDSKAVALTFDAAWGNEDTQTLIDILGRYNVNATFFVVGDWAEKYPESVKALHDAGNEVMNHSDDHAHFAPLSTDEIISNVNRCNDKVEAVTGVRPTLFRAPYGEYDDHVVTAVQSIGMQVVQWDVDSLDWKDYDAKTIYSRVTGKVQPGSIILFHNAALHTPEALPSIIEYLIQNGYEIMKVSDLLLKENYHIDNTGRQIAD